MQNCRPALFCHVGLLLIKRCRVEVMPLMFWAVHTDRLKSYLCGSVKNEIYFILCSWCTYLCVRFTRPNQIWINSFMVTHYLRLQQSTFALYEIYYSRARFHFPNSHYVSYSFKYSVPLEFLKLLFWVQDTFCVSPNKCSTKNLNIYVSK